MSVLLHTKQGWIALGLAPPDKGWGEHRLVVKTEVTGITTRVFVKTWQGLRGRNDHDRFVRCRRDPANASIKKHLGKSKTRKPTKGRASISNQVVSAQFTISSTKLEMKEVVTHNDPNTLRNGLIGNPLRWKARDRCKGGETPKEVSRIVPVRRIDQLEVAHSSLRIAPLEGQLPRSDSPSHVPQRGLKGNVGR
jgi:hypothetical protein